MQAGRENAFSSSGLVARVLAARRATMGLADPLEVEDWVVQSMPDASPVKWHLAHTTWFFERFVLRPLGIAPVSEAYDYLFNSYYESVGSRQPRGRRGMLTRPTAREIVAYRETVDARLAELEGSPRLHEIAAALELGKNHEEQHQELLLTDVKHLLGENPLFPAYLPAPHLTSIGDEKTNTTTIPIGWHRFDEGVVAIGDDGGSFSFDNERPRHNVYIAPFEIASRLVTCGEYRAFIEDGGYRRAELWLSDGWSWLNTHGIRAPMYWDLGPQGNEKGSLFTLRGKRAIAENEPVCHVTYYEADAYARWAKARLPREAEWEIAAMSAIGAKSSPLVDGIFADDDAHHPQPARSSKHRSALGAAPPPPSHNNNNNKNEEGLAQMFGDCWEWTSSAYAPYPGFEPLPGAFGEYNGKFMVSQMVLRGGSCATPRGHVRPTYRNFFTPSAAWQFTGIRLARDIA